MPALLLKNLLLPVNIRLKHAVQIDFHQVGEILVIPACHRIHRLVAKCKSIQKRLHRALEQLHKRFLYRIFG
ncbi:hypothetical protein D3C75_590190 [compost metagenome]